MAEAEFEPARALESLDRHGVDYVLVGGVNEQHQVHLTERVVPIPCGRRAGRDGGVMSPIWCVLPGEAWPSLRGRRSGLQPCALVAFEGSQLFGGEAP